ncbi:MAG: tryptophan-rich sensory protein [Thaumarchaeota archaeon]|nr:tryptophan-rich sensory protein [Nitrososphaerota archaeon]
MSTSRSNLIRLVASVVVCEAAGIIGSVFTISAIPGWYAALQKPWFTSPNWLFAPVWLSLYFLMGAALYLLWGKRPQSGAALAAFTVQLAFNVAWSVVFFGAHELFYGFVVIAALWLTILVTMAFSYRVSRSSAALLVPYIVWVTIASALNYYVWVLNA